MADSRSSLDTLSGCEVVGGPCRVNDGRRHFPIRKKPVERRCVHLVLKGLSLFVCADQSHVIVVRDYFHRFLLCRPPESNRFVMYLASIATPQASRLGVAVSTPFRHFPAYLAAVVVALPLSCLLPFLSALRKLSRATDSCNRSPRTLCLSSQ